MRLRTLLLAITISALLPAPAGAVETWTSTQSLGPTDTVSVAARPGLLLAAGNAVAGKPGFPAPPRSSGLFRSTDEGRTWALASERIVRPDGEIELLPITATPTLLAVPSSSADAFAFFGDAVWRSEDHGATWTPVGSVGATPFTARFLPDGRLLVGLTTGGLRVSADRGATWTSLGTGLPAARVNQVEVVGATFLAATEQGLFRSADGGLTFARVTNGLHQPENTAFGIAAALAPESPVPVTLYLARLGTTAATTAIYRSVDMGATWLLIAPMAWDAQLPRINPGAFAVATHLPNQFDGRSTALYAGGTSGLYFSLLETGAWLGTGPGVTAGTTGLEWVRIDPEPGRRAVRALAVADRNPGAGHADSVFASVIRASVFRAEFHGSESGFTAPGWYDDLEGGNTCLGLLARPDGALFAACARHVFRSDDGGATWRGAGRGLPYIANAVGSSYFPLVASADGSLWTSGFADGLYHSDQEVSGWTKMPFPGGSVGAVATHPTDPKVVYASGLTTNGCCRTVLQRSTDGGLTWLPVLDTGDNIYTIAVSPHDGRRVLVAAFDEGAWLSEDAGATWTRVITGTVSSASFSAAQAGLAYAAGDAGLLVSADGGRTWTASGSSGGSFPILSPWDPDTLYVTSPTDGVRVTRDAGRTWGALGQDLPGAAAGGLAADPRNPGRVYVLAGFLSGEITGGSYWPYRLEGEA